ncbi:hypothetical protein WME73_46050 [Sorangium sp. So ce302]|uniref:hypothetical protein n=1 Tax=Sorangium sp. So ce302 TaxID=3133297 RepID=UPI003F5FE863
MHRYMRFAVSPILVLLGCGGALDPDPGAEANELELIETTALELGSACNESDLAWSPTATNAQKICAVPWEFRLNCYAMKSSEHCDVLQEPEECKVNNKVCDNPGPTNDGDPSTERQAIETRHYGPTTVSCPATSVHKCEREPIPGTAPCRWITTYNCDSACQALATAEKNRVDPDGRPSVTTSIDTDPPPGKISTVNNAPHSLNGTCRYTLHNYPVCYEPCPPEPVYDTCRHSSHGLAPAGSCGSSGETKYMATGGSRADISYHSGQIWGQSFLKNKSGYTYQTEPFCRTCDSLPLSANSSNTEVRAKFDCLKAQLDAFPTLPAAAGGANLKRELVSRLKLLFELKSHQLTQTQQVWMHALYKAEGALSGTCGTAFTPPAGVPTSCDASGAMTYLNNWMAMCTRMSSPHVPAASAASVISECALAAAKVAEVSDECQGQAYRDAYHTMWMDLFAHSLTNFKRVGADKLPDSADVQLRLQHINAWYHAAATHLYPAPAADDRLWREASDMLRLFWQAAYDQSLVSSVTGGDGHRTTTATALDPLNTGLKVDHAVVSAALTPATLPLDGPVLLMLLGDGLRGLHERMEDFSHLHDLGCRFKGCEAGAVQTEMSELWSLFAAAADPARLPGALTAATQLAASPYAGHSGWRDVFNKLSQKHATFQAAVTSSLGVATYSPSLLTEPDPGRLSPPVVALAKMFQRADAATDSYARIGSFRGLARNTLRMGIQESKRAALDAEVQRSEALLTAAKDDYVAHRAQYVTNVLQQLDNGSDREELTQDLERKVREFYELNEDLVGLKDNIAIDEAQFGEFAAAFNTAREQEATAGEQMIERAPPQTLNLTGGSARYSPPAGGVENDVLRFAVQRNGAVFSLHAGKGDILNLTSTGSYVPSCALRTTQLPVPWVPGATAGVVSSPTGPGGYLVTYENDRFQAYSVGESTFDGVSQTERSCVGAAGNLVVNFYGLGGGATATLDDCSELTHGSQTTTSDQRGFEQRTSASLAAGLRLPGTPFPDAPVGSLLLVELPRGGILRSQIRDVRVLQEPNTSVVVNSNEADYYLVVNDKAGCGADPIGAAYNLALDIQHLTPSGAVARAMGQAMAETLTELRNSVPAKLTQGAVTPSELGALRAAADLKLLTKFAAACPGCAASQMPDVYRSLFDAFVSKELAQLERRVQIYALERAIETLQLEFQFLRDDLASNEEKARLLELLPMWNLRNLDGHKMRDGLRALSTLVTDYLHPVMDLRYPGTAGNLRTHAALTNLVRADWSAAFPELTVKALDAVTAIKSALSLSRTTDTNPHYTLVALSFPKPVAPGEEDEAPSTWSTADGERSEAVWSSLLSTGRFTLKITPEDLYTSEGGNGGWLQCTEAAPILHTMAFYVVRPNGYNNETLNGQMKRAAVQWASTFDFTGEDVTKTYVMDSPEWLVGSPRVLFGGAGNALAKFQEHETLKDESDQNIAGDGLSPFGTMEVDLAGLRNAPSPLDDATELVVTMQVDRRTVLSASQPTWCSGDTE